MLDFNATLSPGYTEAITLPLEAKTKFKTNQPQFHWNLVTRLSNQIREKTGESDGWRQMVLTLISEKSWMILERGNSGEPYGSLELLIREGMSLTVDDFVEAVARFAGPDMVDMLQPHLHASYGCNNHNSPQRRAEEAYSARQAAAAPEIAVRLRAADLITQRDLERLGKLNTDDAHQETLELITDRLNEMEPPPTTASATDRRYFRAQVKAVIQHVLPEPQQQQSKVVRLPNDAVKALALLQEHLDTAQLQRLRELICSADAPSRPEHKASRPPVENILPTREQALEEVLALADDELTTAKNAYVLTGARMKFSTFQGQARDKLLLGGPHFVEGNGWKFRKLSPDEMQARQLAPRAASWEVIDYGND